MGVGRLARLRKFSDLRASARYVYSCLRHDVIHFFLTRRIEDTKIPALGYPRYHSVLVRLAALI